MYSYKLVSYRPNMVYLYISVALNIYPINSIAHNDIEFNTDVLDVEDKKNINLNHFSRANYIIPGSYSLTLRVNGDELSEIPVKFITPKNDPKGSEPCLSPVETQKLGLTKDAYNSLAWWNDNQCVDPNSLVGMSITGDFSTSSLNVSVPQAYLEYSAPNWDPPSRWDEGIPAIMLDYNLNATANHSYNDGNDIYALNGNGLVGINTGAWRWRAEWQSRLDYNTQSYVKTNNDFRWNRFYTYRAIPSLQSKLTLGEDYLQSNIFDSFRFIGGSLRSDINMMPPILRGYAPEVTGIAQTNATVMISQQGRTIYETQVAPGPFRIQDLSDAVSGKLDVTVKEQDGSTQQFQVDTASLPFLTRPGQVQYKLALGQPTDIDRHSQGDSFATGEFSWGVTNGWSLFSGTLNSQNYNALSLGLGRDLLSWGAISGDITHSISKLPSEERIHGGSYRVNYSKRFEAIDSQIQFAGYRFSDRNYMTMSDYLSARQYGERYGSSKEQYTVSMSKNFSDAGASVYLNYNHQTFWDRPDNDYYSVMFSKYFDIGTIKNVSLTVSANRSIYQESHDDSGYLSVNIPWGSGGQIGYSLDTNRHDTTNRMTYYNSTDERNSYQLSVGNTRKGLSSSAFVTHQGDLSRITANASYMRGQYSAVGASFNGGLTLTPNGGAFHRMSSMGGTRLLVDTDGISDVPIKGYGSPITSNRFGKAVVTELSSYYRNKASIDLNALPNDVDAQQSVVQATLTEGAVGYRKFSVISGQKRMVEIRLADHSFPPFGAQIFNQKGQEVGIVGDSGSAYVSGINANEVMSVQWGGDAQCQITFPEPLQNSEHALLLPCRV